VGKLAPSGIEARPPALAVVGPTGGGKSALAVDLAKRLGGEIVGVDSVQLYRGFDIGSAKPSAAERARVPHHLFDVLEPTADCSAQDYARLARPVIEGLVRRGRLPVLVGGTGLYLRALTQERFHDDLPQDEALRATLRARPLPDLYAELEQLDPARARQVHPNDRFRVARALELVLLLGKPLAEARPAKAVGDEEGDLEVFTICLEPPRAVLHRRIEARTTQMLAAGLVDEVRSLLARGVPASSKPMRSIGYAEVSDMLAGTFPESELPARIAASTRQYAKRQCTWFKKAKVDLRLTEGGPAAVAAVLAALPTHDALRAT
jgi:tRNA dimethylallyltransferase